MVEKLLMSKGRKGRKAWMTMRSQAQLIGQDRRGGKLGQGRKLGEMMPHSSHGSLETTHRMSGRCT